MNLVRSVSSRAFFECEPRTNDVNTFRVVPPTLFFYLFRGGLELLELRKGTTVKTYIPKVAEGVFTVICMFTEGDEYVLYYHSGKKTLRVFRTTDTIMIANYRMQAELTSIKSTTDGKGLVLGTIDGCLSVLAIADPENTEIFKYLADLPSRDEQWKKKLAKAKARIRFKATIRITRLCIRLYSKCESRLKQESNAAKQQKAVEG